jgi:type III restriction enzyme
MSPKNLAQASLLDVKVTTAPCVPMIRDAVEKWRGKYKGTTEATRLLLNYWFHTDHRSKDGSFFRYHHSQRQAIETLVYLFEVVKIRRHKDLLETFASQYPGSRLLQYDDFARYCVKMATGSGKTKVMALAMAWQYFNAIGGGGEGYARNFLLLAPNIIVFERLRSDFGGGRIFRLDPVIPAELEIFWDFECYSRGETERAGSQGALYLTNIQQFYERSNSGSTDEPEEMTAVLGSKPPAATTEVEGFDVRLAQRGDSVLVINDEAHHTHEEDSEWNKIIRRLHHEVPGGLSGQLDFTATPRYKKGGLFTWTVYDYPLKQAILDAVVKRPMRGVAAGLKEQPSDHASAKYQAYLTAGVERWREYREQLHPLKKKPILFVMLNSTAEADDAGNYLQVKYPGEFGGEKTLVIHTDRSGEVSKKDLAKARVLARDVDEGESPVNAIVSVLMLREGWDVQNVTVVVGLRPYTSTANILPEQTIGRGLRLMFRGFASAYTERVDVIGNKAFLRFVEQLEKEEDIMLDTFDLDKDKLVIETIHPDPEKLKHDIMVPVLSPILARKKTLAEEISALDVWSMECPIFPKTETDKAALTFSYEGFDFISLEKIVEREYTVPEPQTSEEVISYYAKRIAQDVKLPSQFAALAPKVQEFLEIKAFGEKVHLNDKGMIKAISTSVAQYVTVKVFTAALKTLVVEELTPTLLDPGRNLSGTPPFPFSRPTHEATKTVFNLVASDNEFERDFAKFLEGAVDVRSFAKLPSQFRFTIEYTDSANNLRYYEPDFVARLDDGSHFVIETKGREDVDVAFKDRAAQVWCENATLLTGTPWAYVKVPQVGFVKLQPTEFSDVQVVFMQG